MAYSSTTRLRLTTLARSERDVPRLMAPGLWDFLFERVWIAPTRMVPTDNRKWIHPAQGYRDC